MSAIQVQAAAAVPLAAGSRRRYKQGRWYGGASSASSTAFALVVDRLYFVRLEIDAVRAFDRIGMDITGAGGPGSIIRVGLYADDGRGEPTGPDLLALGANLDGTSATVQALTIALTLQPGLYHRAAVAQVASPTVRGTIASMNDDKTGMFSQSDGYANGVIQSGASGALPAAAPTADTTGIPFIHMRAV